MSPQETAARPPRQERVDASILARPTRSTPWAIGFTEAEIGRTTETFGRVTHAFSAYEPYREDQEDPDVPFARGINSIQLLHHEDRWWVVSIFWDSERPDNPIPERYLSPTSGG